MDDQDEVTWPDPRRPGPKGQSRRRVIAVVVVALLLVGAVTGFLVVTGYTGFPGPGALRRYPTRDLEALANRINGLSCGVYATPVEPGSEWSPPAIATVDRLRSRVHLRGSYLVLLPPDEVGLVDNPGDTAPALGCHP
jgi:hypothetical protein